MTENNRMNRRNNNKQITSTGSDQLMNSFMYVCTIYHTRNEPSYCGRSQEIPTLKRIYFWFIEKLHIWRWNEM